MAVSQRQFESAVDSWYSSFRAHSDLMVTNVYFEELISDKRISHSEVARAVGGGLVLGEPVGLAPPNFFARASAIDAAKLACC